MPGKVGVSLKDSQPRPREGDFFQTCKVGQFRHGDAGPSQVVALRFFPNFTPLFTLTASFRTDVFSSSAAFGVNRLLSAAVISAMLGVAVALDDCQCALLFD